MTQYRSRVVTHGVAFDSRRAASQSATVGGAGCISDVDSYHRQTVLGSPEAASSDDRDIVRRQDQDGADRRHVVATVGLSPFQHSDFCHAQRRPSR